MDRLHTMKQRYENRAAELTVQLENSITLASSHFVAFYDAFRLYGKGISQVGFGGNSFGAKFQPQGIDWVHFLPPGMGEPAVHTHLKQEKYERARRRKNAAVSAIEREKLRRELDDEEREKRRQFEISNAQGIRDEEEKNMFGEVYSGLIGSREDKLSVLEANALISQWEKLLHMRERRYPDSLKLAVIANDVACVKLELFPESDLRMGQAIGSLRQAATLASQGFSKMCEFAGEVVINQTEAHSRLRGMLISEEADEFDEAMEEYEQQKREQLAQLAPVPEAPTFCFESLRGRVAPHSPAAFFLLFLNYFTLLRRTKSTHELGEPEVQCMKEMVSLIYSSMLNAKERKNIALERKMELFTVFPLGDVKESLRLTLDELEEHRRALKKTMDSEALQRRLEEYDASKRVTNRRVLRMGDEDNKDFMGIQALALVDPKQAREMKFRKQMKAAKRQRKISIKQRNKMYRMIATDEISDFFHAQARKADINRVTWGNEEEEDKEVEDPFYVSESSSDEDSIQLPNHSHMDTTTTTATSRDTPHTKSSSGSGKERDSEGNNDKYINANDASSLISDTSSLTNATGLTGAKKSVMSFLMKGRKGT